MTTTAFSINKKVLSNAKALEVELSAYIYGELNKESLELLNFIAAKNPSSLKKIIAKCKRLGLSIKAYDFNLVVEALSMQAALSNKVLPTIHAHLLDKKVNNIADILQVLVENLQTKLPATDVMRATMHVIDNLDVFEKQNTDEQLIKSIMLLMISFHCKQTKSVSCDHLDSAKWLKNLLGISQKSSLMQLIDYIAIRIAIAKIEINGPDQSMQLTEVFCVFDEITENLEIFRPATENKKILRDINACILIGMLCKENSHAMPDVVINEMQEQKLSGIDSGKYLYSGTENLDEFIHSDKFNCYFKSYSENKHLNGYTFIANLSKLLTSELISNAHIELQPIHRLLEKCLKDLDIVSTQSIENYMKKIEISEELIDKIHLKAFKIILKTQKDDLKLAKSLKFISRQLIALGFSPRSTSYSNSGIFQPLIVKDKSSVDYKNIKVLQDYLSLCDLPQRTNLIKDILITLIMRYKTNPCVLENQPKPMPKRKIDNSHPIPAVHHYTNINAPSANNPRAKINYPMTFFAKSYPRQENKPLYTKINKDEVDGQQYGL